MRLKGGGTSGLAVIDASNLVVGRLASVVAKRLLSGEKIVVLNAEKAVLSGKKASRLREFKAFLEVVGRANPELGPRHYRRPDTMLRRTVRGMLPMEKAKGREAFKRLRVYVNVPPEFQGVEAESVPEASASKLRSPFVRLGTIASEIGWKGA